MSATSLPLCGLQLFAYCPQQAVAHFVHYAFCALRFSCVPSGAEVDGRLPGESAGFYLHVGKTSALQAQCRILNLPQQRWVVCGVCVLQQIFQFVASGQSHIPFGGVHE